MTSTPPGRPVQVERIRVFTTRSGRGGNLLGVALPGQVRARASRSRYARRLGYPELVFIDSLDDLTLEIYGHDGRAMTFAGHPLVGAGWLLGNHLGADRLTLRPPAGAVETWRDPAGIQWIVAPARYGPQVSLLEYATPAVIDRLTGAPAGHGFAYCWAWQDRGAGRLRARCFAPDHGVPEDEATGGAAIRLAATLGRALVIEQGQGSVLYARPEADDHIALGGYVTPATRR